MEDFKIKNLTPEQSRVIQEIVFNNGGKWFYGRQNVTATDSPMLFLTDGIITHDSSGNGILFTNKKSPEITFEEFERKYITKLPQHISELPFVEMEVRDDDRDNWLVRKVVVLLGLGCYSISKDGDRLNHWYQYRPIKTKTTITKQQIAEKFGIDLENLTIEE